MKIITVILSLAACLPLIAASPYEAGEVQIDLFGTSVTTQFDDYQHGAGVGLSYFPTRTFGVGVEGVSFRQGEAWLQSLDEVNVHAIARQPLGDSSVALYGLLGAGNNFTEHEWRLNAGAGLEARVGPFGVFGDGRWVTDFDSLTGYAQFRAGLRLNF